MDRVLLICHVGSKIGIGHLSRLLALAETLKKDKRVVPEFLIFGDCIKKNDLAKFKVNSFSLVDNFVDTINKILITNEYSVLIFDLYPSHHIDNLNKLFKQLKQRDLHLISVDALMEHCDILDLIWVPSFNFDCDDYSHCNSVLRSGWDSFLIQKRLEHTEWSPGSKILILTGGSDVSKLGKTLPAQLDEVLGKDAEVHWVRGPFADAPIIPNKCRLNWTIHNAPEQLDELIVQSDYVMTVFGVSFFEILQYGIPTVVFSHDGMKDHQNLDALSKEGVAMVEANPALAINSLVALMHDDKLAREYSMKALRKMSINGVQNLCSEIYSLLRLI
jgi:spore coat polysaccharide biosynthesis predicted glycosyltransferase SpsG